MILPEHYGLPAREVRPLPGGYHRSSFVVDGAYVLKFYEAMPSLGIVAALGEAGFPVAAPIRSPAGDLFVALDDGRFAAVFPFLPGRTPDRWPVWDGHLLRALGFLIRQVHDFAVPAGVVPTDDLGIPFAEELRALSATGLPYAAEAAEQLERLRGLHVRLGERVLCHTDVGGDNILVTPAGELVLLDWDEAVLGPAENDFILFARDEPPGSGVLRTVLDGYGAAIDPVRLAYCRLRRYLGDACVRLGRLAEPDCPDRSGVEADLVEWAVRPWRALADPH